jgi:hypothetical protein
MSSRKRVAERDHTLMIPISDMGGQAALSANALFVGPGEPGPGDDWKMPTGPLDEAPGEDAGQDEVTVEPVHSDGRVVLPRRPTHRG